MRSSEVIIKEIDDQGRIVIPAKWRKKYNAKKVKLIIKDDEVIIKPIVTKKLSDLFDTIEVDLKAPLTNWKKTKAELLSGEEE